MKFFQKWLIRAPFCECEYGIAVSVHDEGHLPVPETFSAGFCRMFVGSHVCGSLAPVSHLMVAMVASSSLLHLRIIV